MSHIQDEFPQSMFQPRDIFLDDTDNETTKPERGTPLPRYGVAALVGGIIGAGIAHNSDLGPGGAELVPMVGAGAGVLVLRVKDSIVRVWKEFAYAEGLD